MAAAPPPNDPSSSDPSSASIAASSSSQLAADRRVPGRQYQFFDPREDDDNPTGNAVPSPISSPLRLQGSIDRTEGSGDKRRRSDAEDDRSFVARVFNIPPPQIESGPPVETLHSVYNRGDDSETFPIAVPRLQSFFNISSQIFNLLRFIFFIQRYNDRDFVPRL